MVKPGKAEQFFDVHVNLKDGAVLDEVKDRIPSLRFLLSSKIAEERGAVFPVKENPTTCASMDGAVRISTAELNKRIVSNEMPNYPPAAKAVRAVGESVFELVISAEGDVECVTPISGHPLLRAALTNAIKKWKFEKSQARYAGKIIIEGKSVLMLNGNVVEY